MSRSVPFEDPLLHPPSPPVGAESTAGTRKQPEPVKSPLAAQVDDGPIPFQTTSSADSSSIFTPPPFKPQAHRAAATPSPQPAAVNTIINPTTTTASATTKPAQPDFVDPLSAASSNDDLTTTNNSSSGSLTSRPSNNNPKRNSAKLTSPSIGIPVVNNSMPTEFPTHLASPPLPQRPPTIGGTTFSAFQAFSTALNPSTAAGTPIAATPSESGTPAPGVRGVSDLILDGNPLEHPQQQHQSHHQSQPSIGLGLDHPPPQPPSAPIEAPVPTESWAKRHSIGVSTNPSGISFQDQGDMVRQELRSPEQETGASSTILSTPRSPPEDGNRVQLHIRAPGDQGKDQSFASIRSPGFAIPQSPMRKEGFPVLNAHNMFHEITMTDAMNDLMVKHIPADQRVLRDWSGLTEAEQRQASRSEILHELTINNSWRAMTRYTRSQILMTPSEYILELINLWYARLLALVKLGQYEMAQAELDQLGDLYGPQYRYENYAPDSFAIQGIQSLEQPHGDGIRRGCMVPFEMFILKARLQGYLGDIYEAIDQLYELIMRSKKFEAICQVSDDLIGIKQWQDIAGQLHLMVLNYLVELKDYPTATKHARDLSRKYPHDVNFQSGLGRLYLQLGDLVRAEEVFKEVDTMVKSHHSEAEQAHFCLQLTMNRALLAVTQGQWLVAKAAFEEVLAQEPENLAATNNLAVCELYAGQLNEAIPRVEKLMFAYPTSAGTSEPLVFNMATLYELRTEGSFRKKQQVMVEVSKWAGDQFNVSMFKI
ncbi:Trafficking protein particle complex subunit 12 [Linnemannia exigua]|uniref:Trafficking protein particle complex subunit 12 n=1 Tax=Linnemannia exigua TaxID=604196 RepID=A0AAD4DDN8_9FUNG|nr:Trafficking protein particle complex subunit 12 [Linnemannia exigua]